MDIVRGSLVRSSAGRDSGRVFAVVAVEGQMLFLADGSLRTLAHPKRKKNRHVAPIATVLPPQQLLTDSRLREAIEQVEALS